MKKFMFWLLVVSIALNVHYYTKYQNEHNARLVAEMKKSEACNVGDVASSVVTGVTTKVKEAGTNLAEFFFQ